MSEENIEIVSATLDQIRQQLRDDGCGGARSRLQATARRKAP
jgi:hypothetical protein